MAAQSPGGAATTKQDALPDPDGGGPLTSPVIQHGRDPPAPAPSPTPTPPPSNNYRE